MSSRSASNKAPPDTADTATLRWLAVAAIAVFAFFAQTDALSNRLSFGSPLSPFALSTIAVFGTTLLVALREPLSPRAAGTTGARLILMLMAWAVLCWAMSEHHREGYDYLKKLAISVAPALCLMLVADRPRHLHAIVWAMIAAGIVSAMVVMLEVETGTRLLATSLAATTADFDGVARSSGASDQNPTTAAQMLMVSVALAIGLLFAGERRWRIVLLGLAVVGSAALAVMSARSAILGLGATGGCVLLAFRGKSYFPAIVVAGIIVAAVGIAFAPPTLIERFAAIGDFAQDQTLYRRITYLRIGADLIGNSPIWGVGPGNFPLYYVTDAYRWLPGRIPVPRELHNTFLDVATEFGLVGLAIFACLIVTALRAARRAFAGSPELARVAFAIAVALVGLLVACFFMPHKDLRYLWLMFGLALQCGRLRKGEAR